MSTSDKPDYISKEFKARAIKNMHLDKLKKTTEIDIETLPVISPRAHLWQAPSPRHHITPTPTVSQPKELTEEEHPADIAVNLARAKPMNHFWPSFRNNS